MEVSSIFFPPSFHFTVVFLIIFKLVVCFHTSQLYFFLHVVSRWWFAFTFHSYISFYFQDGGLLSHFTVIFLFMFKMVVCLHTLQLYFFLCSRWWFAFTHFVSVYLSIFLSLYQSVLRFMRDMVLNTLYSFTKLISFKIL